MRRVRSSLVRSIVANRPAYGRVNANRNYQTISRLSTPRALHSLKTFSVPSRGNIGMTSRVTFNSHHTELIFVRAYSVPSHIKLELPALSPTGETASILEWKKKEGDPVAAGDVIAEIETDKTTISWNSTDEGFLAKILAPAGTKDIPIGQLVAILVEDKADVAKFKDFQAPAAGAPAQKPAEAAQAAPATPAPQAAAPQAAVPQPQVAATTAPSGGRVAASPLARKTAEEKGVNLQAIAGTGPGGRIINADVLEFKPTVSAPAAAVPIPAVGDFTDIPASGMRKVIAQRLTEAKQKIPHYYLTVDIRMDNLLKLRSSFNDKGEGKYKLSVNDFLVKAAGVALRKVPEVNSSWGGDFIRRYNNVDVSVAVNTEEGLFTPIVTNADRKGLVGISENVKDLAAKAKAKKLAPQEYQGGSFTISNLGMFGIKQFTAVINPPQSCILAVGATEKRVIVNEKNKENPFDVASIMTVTLSCDHRVVDGAVGARWLAVFKELVEDPVNMLL